MSVDNVSADNKRAYAGGKNIWIVDGAYLMKSSEGRGKFDYVRLKEVLEEQLGEQVHESYYFSAVPFPPSEPMDAFHNWMKSAAPRGPRMRVKLHKLRDLFVECPECNYRFERQLQKGVDVGIVTQIMKLAVMNRYDRLILSAGDGDLEESISFVKDHLGKKVWLMGFEGTVSSDLQCTVDHVMWLDNYWDDIRR